MVFILAIARQFRLQWLFICKTEGTYPDEKREKVATGFKPLQNWGILKKVSLNVSCLTIVAKIYDMGVFSKVSPRFLSQKDSC